MSLPCSMEHEDKKGKGYSQLAIVHIDNVSVDPTV